MHESLIWNITKNVSITTALSAKNIEYKIQGNAILLKSNPFRQEKTCSIQGYLDSNLLYDFGAGNTFNSFDILAIDSDVKHAIKLGLRIQNDTVTPTTRPIPPYKHITNNDTDFIEEFNRFEKINLHNDIHLQEMINILPLHKWLHSDLNSFLNQYCRFDSRNNTLVVGIFQKNTLVGYKWRRLNINGVTKKWIARRGSIASTPMLNIINSSTCVFVCEGIHDFLSTTMARRSVLSIPSANYTQNLPDYILDQLANMTIYLVPDNDAVGFKLMERMRQQLSSIPSMVINLKLPPDVHDFSDFLALEQDTAIHNSRKNFTTNFDMDFQGVNI